MPNVTNGLKIGISIWEVHSTRLANVLWSKDTSLASAYPAYSSGFLSLPPISYTQKTAQELTT